MNKKWTENEQKWSKWIQKKWTTTEQKMNKIANKRIFNKSVSNMFIICSLCVHFLFILFCSFKNNEHVFVHSNVMNKKWTYHLSVCLFNEQSMNSVNIQWTNNQKMNTFRTQRMDSERLLNVHWTFNEHSVNKKRQFNLYIFSNQILIKIITGTIKKRTIKFNNEHKNEQR